MESDSDGDNPEDEALAKALKASKEVGGAAEVRCGGVWYNALADVVKEITSFSTRTKWIPSHRTRKSSYNQFRVCKDVWWEMYFENG